jgi:hypothetical protein
MAKIIPFTGVTKLDLEPDVLLENYKGEFEGFVIAGFSKNGEEIFASSYADGGTALWLVERFKRRLMAAAEAGGWEDE